MNEQELKQWEMRIRLDERAYLLELLAAVRNGECDDLMQSSSIAEAMTKADRLKADNDFLKSLGIKPISY